MKPSRKANKIYETLRKDILRRRFAPGMLLPGEIEYAAELGISRDTLRKALDMLEAEHLVRILMFWISEHAAGAENIPHTPDLFS